MTTGRKLPRSFYLHDDVVELARALLGKVLVTELEGKRTAGIITETEAYAGINDSASHAYQGRRTARNEVMYAIGGTAYVYINYGLHHLFNVVTNREEIPHAILIRSIEPLEGLDVMLERRGKQTLSYTLTTGPGSAARALGITKELNGADLLGHLIWIEDRGISFSTRQIATSPRIGIDSCGKDRLKPYRFLVKDSPWVSRSPQKLGQKMRL
ncbi:MAG: DNA-3-methyladenine glycosylase [Chitinophagales bacterium]|nr:DNA-3-methyladenine glycosylase [Chitinophagales bacterium]MDW8428131.1 DNA-3-methyladenine glycosylase [Chitinophagales bacterium]